MRVFITGIAGFIGFHVAKALSKQKVHVSGVDNFNDYYDPLLKKKRASILQALGIEVIPLDLCSSEFKETVKKSHPTHFLHLAAQAGVRCLNPKAYVRSNIEGFTQVLETIREHPRVQLVYASSSSVYGLNSQLPFSVKDRTDHQASFYGVTKKANELMAFNYAHIFGIRAIGLRYFTVYGPWGRPDMALFGFTRSILEGKSIDLYNFGKMQRDFTYIDDIVAGTISALSYQGTTPLFNLGHHAPVSLIQFVEILEQALQKKAIYQLLPLQPGDMISTYADITESQKELGFTPKIKLEEGIAEFVKWYTQEIAKGGT